MADEGKVIIELVGKDNATQAFISSLRGMEDSLKKLESTGAGLDRLGGKFDSLASHWKALAGAFGGTYLITKSINEMVDSFKKTAEAEYALEHLSVKLGASTRDLSALQFAAQRSGLEIGQLDTGITRMTRNISEAALGIDRGKGAVDEFGDASGKGAEALRNLGLNAQILNKLPLQEKLMAVAVAMKGISEPAEKVRIAFDIFGRGGTAMLQLANRGPAAIKALTASAEHFGVVVNDSMGKRATAAVEGMKNVESAFQGIAIQATDKFAPAVAQGSNALAEWIVRARQSGATADFFNVILGVLNGTVKVGKTALEGLAPYLEIAHLGFEGIGKMAAMASGAMATFNGWLDSIGNTIASHPEIYGMLSLAAQARQRNVAAYAGQEVGFGVIAGAAAGGAPKPLTPEEADAKAMDELRKKYPGLFGTGTRTSPASGKGLEAAQNALQSFINLMQTEIAKASGDALDTLDAWYKKEADSLKKIEEKTGASLEAEAALTAAYDAKKKALTREFFDYLAKESGDAYRKINKDLDDNLAKYKGIAGAKASLEAVRARQFGEQSYKDTEAWLTLQKGMLEKAAGATQDPVQQLALRRAALALEIQESDLALKDKIARQEATDATRVQAGLLPLMTAEMKDQLLAAEAMDAVFKKQTLDLEGLRMQGFAGGLEYWRQTQGTKSATADADLMISTLTDLQTKGGELLASSFSAGLEKRKPGETMAAQFRQALIRGMDEIGKEFFKKAAQAAFSRIFESLLGSRPAGASAYSFGGIPGLGGAGAGPGGPAAIPSGGSTGALSSFFSWLAQWFGGTTSANTFQTGAGFYTLSTAAGAGMPAFPGISGVGPGPGMPNLGLSSGLGLVTAALGARGGGAAPGFNLPGGGSLATQAGGLLGGQIAKWFGGGGGPEYETGGGLDTVEAAFAGAEGGILPGRFRPLPGFQTGGIISKPTLGWVGEGAAPEAVIPLQAGKVPVSMQGKAGHTFINNITIQTPDVQSFKASGPQIMAMMALRMNKAAERNW